MIVLTEVGLDDWSFGRGEAQHVLHPPAWATKVAVHSIPENCRHLFQRWQVLVSIGRVTRRGFPGGACSQWSEGFAHAGAPWNHARWRQRRSAAR